MAVVFTCLAVFICGCGERVIEPISGDDYQVYGAAIRHARTLTEKFAVQYPELENYGYTDGRSRIIIQDSTNHSFLWFSPENDEADLEELILVSFPDEAAWLAADFDSKNRNKPQSLTGEFPDDIQYHLASEAELPGYSENWQPFQDKFPDAYGHIKLSRVGFNEARDRALVYVDFAHGREMWDAYFILCAKNGESWDVVKTEQQAVPGRPAFYTGP